MSRVTRATDNINEPILATTTFQRARDLPTIETRGGWGGCYRSATFTLRALCVDLDKLWETLLEKRLLTVPFHPKKKILSLKPRNIQQTREQPLFYGEVVTIVIVSSSRRYLS